MANQTPNRWAIRDSGEVTFWSLVNGKPIVTLRTLKTTGLEATGETVYARGGFGNPKIVGFSGNRESKLSLQDSIWDNKAIAMLTGNDLVEGAQDVAINEEVVVSTNKGSVKKTPVGDLLGVFKLLADGTLGKEFTKTAGTVATGEYKLTLKEITFFAGDLSDGEKVVVYYTAKTDASAKKISVTSDAFGKTFKVTIDLLVRDIFTQEDFAAQAVVHVAKFEDNFNLALSVDGDPAVLDLNMEILAGGSTNKAMWDLIVYDLNSVS